MKQCLKLIAIAALCGSPCLAQDRAPGAPKTSGDYATDLGTVRDAQSQALDQAKEALDQTTDAKRHAALDTAIKEMEKAESALDAAKGSPEKLAPAVAAEQAAYQALLKVTPREFQVSRQRNGRAGGGAGQPSERQLDQLEMKDEANRYETESQASAAPTQQQREQAAAANRLKELAQRQQDLNDRLRELQTALQAAKTDQEREDIERQLKRLRDEERQMLSDVDELKQNMEQSQNANSMANARQQLEQTRSDVQRAAQELEKNSPSQALAAGTRAEQSMQNARSDLRRQTSSQFSDQVRQLRDQARNLAQQENDIAKKLDAAQTADHKSLDNASDTQQLSDQMTKQEGALTNLLSEMRSMSEQSENVEPLLSQKLYDTFRQADQKHTDNLLDMGAQLAQRGFLPQAGEAERAARTNINELRQGVESAAQSVLGNESDALRYAQNELDDLSRQMERELGTNGNNRGIPAAARAGGNAQSNQLANARGSAAGRNGSNREGNTNGVERAAGSEGGQTPGRDTQQAQNGSQGGQRGGRNAASAQNNQSGNPQNGNQGGQPRQGNSESAQNDQQGNSQNGNQGGQPGEQGQQASAASRQGGQPGRNQNGNQGNQGGQGQQASATPQDGQSGQGENGQSGQGGNPGDSEAQNNNDYSQADQPGNGEQAAGNAQGGQNNSGRLGGQRGQNARNSDQITGGDADWASRRGTPGGGIGGRGGPITGSAYLDWSQRLRDVEQALDSQDLRNQLATVRERAAALRSDFRLNGRPPDDKYIRQQIIEPMTQVRVWLQEELARQNNADSLVPLDRDPVPDNYSDLVKKYYEKLGSAQ
jgi:hypothetical protein